jgi:peroxiredoxin
MRLALIAVGLAMAGVLAACTSGASADATYRFHSATPLGSVIPSADQRPIAAITGLLLNGDGFAIAGDRGQVVVLNFWAAWCSPCRVETPQLDLLYREVHADGIDFVGVDTKEVTRSAGTSFVQDNQISYPMLSDEPGKVALQLGHIPSASLPFTVPIDKQQRVAAVYLSAVTPADLRPVLVGLVTE